LRALLFPKALGIQRLWDGFAVLLAVSAGMVAFKDLPWYIKALSSSMGILSILILLSNRSRLEKLIKKKL
jgi:hypothetical protein